MEWSSLGVMQIPLNDKLEAEQAARLEAEKAAVAAVAKLDLLQQQADQAGDGGKGKTGRSFWDWLTGRG